MGSKIYSVSRDYIDLDTALIAREVGFPFVYWGWIVRANKILRKELLKNPDDPRYYPDQSMVTRWLREVHGIYVSSNYVSGYDEVRFYYRIDRKEDNVTIKQDEDELFTYEESLELGLVEALKLIK